jgi:predicted component of type VI protein secretion system
MARRTLVGLAGVLLLGGCSGTPFGDQLSRSFSSPPGAGAPAGQATATKPDPALAPDAAKKADLAKASDPAKLAKVPASTAKAPEAQPLPAPATLAPAPYRVTIKLPAADPSAPAEVVTKALRAAGVSFEVETIERVRNGSQGQGANPSVTPAPQPR